MSNFLYDNAPTQSVRNTKDIGDETEVKCLAALVSRGYAVSVPFGDNDPYDLVVDAGSGLYRVQCKTGWLEDGRIRFKTYSQTTVEGEVTRRDYGDRVDAFAVRCKDDNSLYWIPSKDVGRKNTYLRVKDPAIDHPAVRFAADYEFDSALPKLTR